MKTTNKVNAVLLAGDRRASIALHDDNKAFFELKGIPLFVHVLRALLEADHVGLVAVVGPSGRIEAALREHGINSNVVVVEQRDNMIENFKAGFVAALGFDESVEFWDLKNTHP